jgi:CheY-like chemotaxis protein
MGKTVIYIIFSLITGIVMLPWLFILVIPAILLLFDLLIVPVLFAKYLTDRLDASKPIRILMIDDTPGTLLILKKVLSESNCKLTIVESGREAIAQLQNNKFDLLFLDNYMQDLSGSETLKLADKTVARLVTETNLEKIPVVEYSSCGSDRDNVIDLNHFKLIAKLSKTTPSSNLRPSIREIIEEVKAKAA